MRQGAAPLREEKETRRTAPPPPPPPPGRIVRDGAPPFLIELALVGGFAGLLIFAAPDIAAWLRGQPPASVQTSARIACAPPSEHETRLVYLNARADGSLVLACGPIVGGRGAYPGARP